MMKPRSSNQIFDEIAQQLTRNDIDLSSSILVKVRKEKGNKMKFRYVLSGILMVIVIFVILFTVPSVATAMKRLFGYIPGAGLVDDHVLLRVLKDPVQSSQKETTVTVMQGVIDSEHTTIIYQVENIPASPANLDSQTQRVCHKLPELLLPDGSRKQGQVDSGTSWISGYRRRIVFPPIPENVNSFRLEFSCLEQTTIVPDAQSWEINLDFINAPEDMKVYPLVDLPTPTPEPTQISTQKVNNKSDIKLIVSQYVQTAEDVILFGAIESQSGNMNIEWIDDAAIHVRDAGGKEIPLVYDPSLIKVERNNNKRDSFQWAYHTAGSFSPGIAELTVDSVWIRESENIHFTFDPGQNPQPGQVWDLNKQIVIADKTITIQNAQMNQAGDGVSFTISTPPDVNGITMEDPDHVLLGGGGGEGSYDFNYRDGFPSGKIEVVISSMIVNIPGPWKVSVDLPSVENSSEEPEIPGPCLTTNSWKSAVSNPLPLPEGLDGFLAISNIPEPEFYYHVMTVNLDGTNLKDHATGDGVTLSMDNRQIIYNSDTGLQMMDLETSISTPLQNTGKNDRDALWSPDGRKIAFTRGPSSGLIGAPGPYSIILANPDGSNQTPLVANADANTAQAWLPDNETLIYTVTGPTGASVQTININTGNIIRLFTTKYPYTTVAVSPDGKQVAYQEMDPGDQYAIYVANLDGSNARLVVNTSPIVTTAPQWSPDGKWLVVSVHDEQVSQNSSVLALIEIGSCQIIPLKSKGYVSNWIR